MKLYQLIKLLILLFITTPINAQSTFTANQEKISNSLNDYFSLDRENIHLHLNKKTYLTNETILV